MAVDCLSCFILLNASPGRLCSTPEAHAPGPIPGAVGQTAVVYQVTQFRDGMARLAHLFQIHPELRGLRATVDEGGHVDIIAVAESGVLRDWIRALPDARHKQDLFSLHSGTAIEEVLIEDSLTVRIRPKAGA